MRDSGSSPAATLDVAAPASLAPAAARHLPSLDGLRGLAILLVIVHQLDLLTKPVGLGAHAFSAVGAVGWVGVQLFFVLSGFLITGILVDSRGAANYFSGFFARRVLRIFPLYYATLLVAFVVLPLFVSPSPPLAHDRHHQIWLWTYLSNWVNPYEAGSRAFPHFWSLAVEEQFYLVWPFLLRRQTPQRCLALCAAIAVASLGVRCVMVAKSAPSEAIYCFSVTRMDALALGAIGAAALRVPPLRARLERVGGTRLWLFGIALGVVGAGLTHGYSLEHAAGNTVGYTFLALTFAAFVVGAALHDGGGTRGWPTLLRARPLTLVGKYSYGMYVLHKPLHDFVGKPLLRRFGLDASSAPGIAVAYIAVAAVVTYAAAFASYHLFEARFLALKSKFAPSTR
ncbi:MAG TPA: acyltransferase [Polyangia bacterium]|nr:acyltransferase [Polyangia bacterium]